MSSRPGRSPRRSPEAGGAGATAAAAAAQEEKPQELGSGLVRRRRPQAAPTGGRRRCRRWAIPSCSKQGAASPAEVGPAARVLRLLLDHRRGDRAGAALVLLEDGGRAVRAAEASDLVGDAAGHPDDRRSRRDSVRHHDRDRIRRDRRRRRVPDGLSGEDARLGARQAIGVPDRQDHRDGVLAVRRLGAVLRRCSRFSAGSSWSSSGCCRST